MAYDDKMATGWGPKKWVRSYSPMVLIIQPSGSQLVVIFLPGDFQECLGETFLISKTRG